MSLAIDPLCPIASIANLHGDHTARFEPRVASSTTPSSSSSSSSSSSLPLIIQLLQRQSTDNKTAFFVWRRSLSDARATDGVLYGPMEDEISALSKYNELIAAVSSTHQASDSGAGTATDLLFSATALSAPRRRRAFESVPIDDVRRFWDERPCNLKHGTAPVGTKQFFDQVEARKYKVEPHIPRFADFPRWRDCDVLEVGCGLGTESVNFARAGARLTAVDLSSRSAELTRQRLAVQGVAGTVLVADAESLSGALAAHSADGRVPQFDLVWSFGVIHHTPSPAAAVRELARLVKPGGELRLMVYAKVSYKLFFLMRETGVWDFARIDELLGEYSEAQSGCPVTYSYTEQEVRDELLPASEWEVVSVEKDHIFAYSIPEYRKHEYVREACWANVSDDDFRKLERELGWHLLVRAKRRQ